MGVWYEFGEFRLDPDRRLVWDGNGAPLELAPRAFDALLMMISRPGELIQKAALLSALWPNVTVVENSLDQVVSRLRRALGDTESSPLIVTDRGRGYRFVGRVRAVPGAKASEGPGGRDLQDPARGGTRDAMARELYLQGRTLSSRPSAQNLNAARELFRRALALDPRFAEALANHAQLQFRMIGLGLGEPEALAAVESEARAALALVPDLAMAHVAVADLCAMRGEWNEAHDHFDAAIRSEPFTRLGCVLRLSLMAGHLRLALEQSSMLDEHFPAWPMGAVAAGLACAMLDQDEQAARHADTAELLGVPSDHVLVQRLRTLLALRAHRSEEARKRLIAGLGSSFIAAGGANAVEATISALEEPSLRGAAIDALRAVAATFDGANVLLIDYGRLMECFVPLGALDDAFALLNTICDRYAARGVRSVHSDIIWTREFKPFRRDPRFHDYIRRTRLIEYWERHGPPDGHTLEGGKLKEISG